VVGELLCLGVLFRLTAELSPKTSFALVGFIGLILTLIITLMIEEPARNTKIVV
jgi:hypothetical protein